MQSKSCWHQARAMFLLFKLFESAMTVYYTCKFSISFEAYYEITTTGILFVTYIFINCDSFEFF